MHGPYAIETYPGGIEIGDVIQLGNSKGEFYHSLIVTGFLNNTYLVSTHTDDVYNRRLDTYKYAKIRFLHIVKVRLKLEGCNECFEKLNNGKAL